MYFVNFNHSLYLWNSLRKINFHHIRRKLTTYETNSITEFHDYRRRSCKTTFISDKDLTFFQEIKSGGYRERIQLVIRKFYCNN